MLPGTCIYASAKQQLASAIKIFLVPNEKFPRLKSFSMKSFTVFSCPVSYLAVNDFQAPQITLMNRCFGSLMALIICVKGWCP